jgi:siroheme synthase-like protein
VPVLLAAEALSVLVVGGGTVGARRALHFVDAGARVRVVAPEPSDSLRARAAREPRLTLARRPYASGDVADAHLVIVATGDRAINARVAADAAALSRLANVADAPETGSCVAMATHRAGALVVGVFAGGVPGAATRIRDAIAERFDARYDEALAALGTLRRRLLAAGDREGWRTAAAALAGGDFCERVERGGFAERVAAWR